MTSAIVEKARSFAPGVLIAATVAMASLFIASRYGGPVMLYAILFGIAFNFLSDDEKCAPGIQFASKRVLQLGVILLGASVTLSEIAELGWATALLVVAGVATTISVGWMIGRANGLTNAHATLSAGAVAICGASAAMAISSVLPQTKDSERNLILTVVGVTTLSTIAMVAYPPLTHTLGFTDMQAGVFLGATIHDVAQVIGAGYIVSDEAGAVSAVVKLMRVTLLAPAVFIIAMLFARNTANADATGRAFPIFLLGFAALMAANSFGAIPENWSDSIAGASRFCLITAVAALGVKTSLKKLIDVGPKPITALILQTLWLAAFATAAVFIFSGYLPR
ncbi:putative sulfate exporter family transporter [Hyphococcus flavus]|uniref:Sulfate exporter family transporter n=1 Tax=Hyphococcus flavus TaxID=1866326 RepID=A0AAE9ZDK0_9PROT|nr:putative sulfate exporter family transporter [Hyphococcus flavus]WDI33024.1 putative sulfate exporter family transporter [Hyphococcus flavus]